ncbi:glycosyltransferase family 4 protein [Paenibacillus radicis (ex Xue et al. 2023)]|uniref:Glycosyltransferase family 4 protein n=1 Tax=Paenibacillus radicis (ex Xue et al. 2023) TaxID=2972489 RepID=A0ABT1YGU8_9BACL|nr:glycosyltransferase family 4 protein [Paenibacillus radicis (ex Xue et al. 2023)]MCR8632408.1 glycosyltransferase family 4 protein [Paenibacillus radicis (ex Xue et al. 2023)]
MKVLFISHSNVIKTYQHKISIISENADVEILLVVPKEYKENLNIIRGEALNNNYKFKALNAVFGRSGRQHFHFYPKLFNVLLKFKPDIIHLEEEPRSLITALTIFLSKILRLKAKVIFYTALNIKTDWKERYKIINIRRHVYSICQWYSFKHSDIGIAITDEAGKVLHDMGFAKQIEVISENCGVNLEQYKRKKERKDTKITRIGFVGRLEYLKGLHILLEAISKLEIPFQLTIIGGGDKEKYIKISKKLNLEKHIIWKDHVPHEMMCDVYENIDILVLPSITTKYVKEQFGRVLVEAMASGVPVIGSNSGGIPYVIGDAGLIFEENNVDELKECIEIISLKEGMWEILSEKGFARVKDNFTNYSIAQKLSKIYKELTE